MYIRTLIELIEFIHMIEDEMTISLLYDPPMYFVVLYIIPLRLIHVERMIWIYFLIDTQNPIKKSSSIFSSYNFFFSFLNYNIRGLLNLYIGRMVIFSGFKDYFCICTFKGEVDLIRFKKLYDFIFNLS